MKRAIAVLRVSTDAQDVKRQRADIEKLKRTYDLEIIRTLELVGVSGTATLDDKQVRQVLADLARPEVGGVALSALDRLFRPKRYASFGMLDSFVDQRKVLWTVREGLVDPSSDSGFDQCVGAGGRAGAEWRELIRRCRDGKEVARREGRHPGSSVGIPRGVAFAGGVWRYVEPDASRVREMFRLLLRGDSFHTIAAKVGGGWTFQGVRSTLRSTIWAFGTRVYPANEHRPEAFTVKVIEEPLVPVSVWEAAQAELDRRKTAWRKTKGDPGRFLCSGLLRCQCGKALYTKSASRNDPTHKRDYYCCASRCVRGATKCGAQTIQVKAVDRAVIDRVSQDFTDARVLRLLLDQLIAPPEPEPDTARQIAALEARRKRVIDMREEDQITREECARRLAVVDRELQTARSRVTSTPRPAVDAKRLAAALVRRFARFHKLPFADQRALLREAVRDIIVTDGAIRTLTFRGGFLAQNVSVNLETHSTVSLQIETLPDLTVTLPEPWQIEAIDHRRREYRHS